MFPVERFVLALICTTLASATLDNEYPHSAYLDEDENFRLHWKIDISKKEISFAAQVKTLGWIGFGVSAGTGNMVGSDVVIGWVKDGKGYLKDRYADAKALPPIDEQQDYKLDGAYEKNGETVLRFTRKYDTCDKRDNRIEEGTSRLVYAYHTEDPASETNIPIHTKRGSRSLLLRSVATKPTLPNDVQHFDLRVNTTVSNRHTVYYCKPFEMPKLGAKKHVVKISPIITPGNQGLVHHILIYGCKDDFPRSNLTHEGACFAPNMPGSFGECVGQSVVAAWAIGATSFYFPGHVGYALGDNDGPKFVLMEVHYDNPDQRSGVKDLSGLRFTYTSSLRKYDAGILWVGWDVVPGMWIPPGQQKWTSIGYCSGNCTRAGLENSILNEKGIKVFATMLHAHLLGRALWTKHVRNGKELPEIARDDHYDFNYQEYHMKNKEVHILPGDDIIQYCQYNSLKRANLTRGGLETKEEMCLDFMYYYPKVDLSKCLSISYGTYFFQKNKTHPIPWTPELVTELRETYDNQTHVLTRCRKFKSGRLPIHNSFVPKPAINDPIIKPPTCPKETPSTQPPSHGPPKSVATHVTCCYVVVWIAILKSCMFLY